SPDDNYSPSIGTIQINIPNIEKITKTLNQNTEDNSVETIKPLSTKPDNISVQPMNPVININHIFLNQNVRLAFSI
ncbi:MAG: hypothetical protein ABSA76_10080, partial [Bacteroidales bacterium]